MTSCLSFLAVARIRQKETSSCRHEEQAFRRPDVDRRRHQYLHRLGIRRGAPAARRGSFEQISDSRCDGADCNNEDPAQCKGENECTPVDCVEKRNHRDFRVDFLRKLSYEKVWVPQTHRPAKHQTVIIFDWDDTLLCTSWLMDRAHSTKKSPLDEHLRGIAAAAQKLLELSLRLGHTFIITNAVPMWAQYSAAKYIPQLLPTLEKVRVISARGRHEALYPRETYQWKIQAFLDVQQQLDSEIITNVVSVGDSNCEMDAAHVMAQQFDVALIKLIKFRENPCPLELLMQLEVIIPKFEHIVENARHMRVGLERRQDTSTVGAEGGA